VNEFPVTSILSGLFTLALIPLTIQVGLMRVRAGIFFGNGGDTVLARRRAAQSNFVQYVPFALFLLFLCEMQGASLRWLLAISATLALGRALHAWCFLASDGLGDTRAAGMAFTFLSFAIAAGWLLAENVRMVIGS
jgi:uncharacterized membrane protein YecN with MAPEG domain